MSLYAEPVEFLFISPARFRRVVRHKNYIFLLLKKEEGKKYDIKKEGDEQADGSHRLVERTYSSSAKWPILRLPHR